MTLIHFHTKKFSTKVEIENFQLKRALRKFESPTAKWTISGNVFNYNLTNGVETQMNKEKLQAKKH